MLEQSKKSSLPLVIKRSGRLIDQRIDQLLKQHHLARSQYRVLYYVFSRKQPTQKELLTMLGVKGSTLTSILNTLQHKGLLTRQIDPSDKRVKRLELTASGKSFFSQLPDPLHNVQKSLMHYLTKDEAKTLEQLLQKLIDNLKRED